MRWESNIGMHTISVDSVYKIHGNNIFCTLVTATVNEIHVGMGTVWWAGQSPSPPVQSDFYH